MPNQDLDLPLDKKGILKAMFFALVIAFLGIGILSWQYHRMEKETIPALEEELRRQKEEFQQNLAQDMLNKFMEFRIEKDEARAAGFLTEGAMEQKAQAEFFLIDNFSNYEILKIEKLAPEKYRFIIKLYQEGGMGDFVEAIIVIKILDKYYINSIEMVG